MQHSIRQGVLAAATLSLLSVACRVDDEGFNSKIYACNPSAADPACGVDDSGAAMACVPAYQLGGANFCASACDFNAPTSGAESFVCMPTGRESQAVTTEGSAPRPGAQLKKCDPNAGSGVCGNPELSCMRTDLRTNEGVCMTVNPCDTSADCRDPTRATCMGSLILDTYGEKAELNTDHTYCLQTGCNASGAACSPGESCLRKMLSRAARPPDICVPNCDANQNCPPNYFCIPGLYSTASPPICIPGLPGFRCRSRLDCLVGDCVPTDARFNICSVPCQSDDDCAKLDSEQETFVCNRAEGYCVGPRVFFGGVCTADTQCRTGEVCGFLGAGAKDGNCLNPCAADGSCPSYGGVPHMCLPQSREGVPPVCVPSGFGNPCATDASCVGGMTCRPTGSIPVCSVICLADEDCQTNRFTKDGFCQLPGNLCLPPRKDGSTCDRDVQCESKSCVAVPGTDPVQKQCAKTPGW